VKNALSFDPGVVLKTGVALLGAYTPTPTLRADQLPGVRQPAEVSPGSSRARGTCF
jgi:hypothetical protein